MLFCIIICVICDILHIFNAILHCTFLLFHVILDNNLSFTGKDLRFDMKYIIGICDDEKLMIDINTVYIKNICEKYNIDIELHTFSSGEEIIAYAKSHKLDIAFLDIDMDGISGISAAVALRKANPGIVTIFITGHTEYAIDAFDTDAAGYLVKPLNPEKLEHSIKKAINYIKMSKSAIINKYITITEDNAKKKIPMYQILYFEKVGNQCKILTTKETYYWYTTIKNVLSIIDENFIQISQSIIVNQRYVKEIVKGDVILKDQSVFRIGRQYLSIAKEKFATPIVN